MRTRPQVEHWRCFDAAWFRRHQRRILWWVNGPFRRLTRWALCIDERRPISELGPHFVGIHFADGRKEVDFRTHPKWAKRVYFALAPLWWALHFLDWAVLDRLVPALSFGFANLTMYPQTGSGGSNVTWDGTGYNYTGAGADWTTARTVADFNGSEPVAAYSYAARIARIGTNQWQEIYRGVCTFDTRSIPSSATISAGEFAVCGLAKTETVPDGTDLDICAWNGAAANAWSGFSDFGQFGNVKFGAVTYASYDVSSDVYNVFTLNASGLAGISKAAVSRIGMQIHADLANVEPGGTGAGAASYQCYYADQAGTARDPKLYLVFYDAGNADVVLRGPANSADIILSSTGPRVWVNVAGTWKAATLVQVNVGGAWKTCTVLDVNVSGTWKAS